jgi:superoxide dismutase, Cu-Zn family
MRHGIDLLRGMAMLAIATSARSQSQDQSVDMRKISAERVDDSVGSISLSQADQGVKMDIDLQGLPPGEHGSICIRNCDPAEKDGTMTAGGAAGPHYDSQSAQTHAGPEGQGHLGDLPRFEVANGGTAKVQLIAPRLKLTNMKGRALIIHEGGDTYSDRPELGGGKGRIACGIVQ